MGQLTFEISCRSMATWRGPTPARSSRSAAVGGVPLFGRMGDDSPRLEVAEVISTPEVTHLRYRVR